MLFDLLLVFLFGFSLTIGSLILASVTETDVGSLTVVAVVTLGSVIIGCVTVIVGSGSVSVGVSGSFDNSDIDTDISDSVGVLVSLIVLLKDNSEPSLKVCDSVVVSVTGSTKDSIFCCSIISGLSFLSFSLNSLINWSSVFKS